MWVMICYLTPQSMIDLQSTDLHVVTNYKKISHIPCVLDDQLFVAIRSFHRDRVDYFVLVHVDTLEIKVVPQRMCGHRKMDRKGNFCAFKHLKSSTYYKALYHFNTIKRGKSNQGLKSIRGIDGCFLSIDMCPSIHTIERSLFDVILKSAEINQGIELLIAVSGLWMATHPEEFIWLQNLRRHHVHITWVNHSFSHIYYPDRDAIDNFLLLPNTDIESEILNTEIALIEKGALPAPFFRFPGLIANQEILDKLTTYGLIQLGASGWIGILPEPKIIKKGDIILVHGNGNENKKALDTAKKFIQSNKFLWKNLQKELSNSDIYTQCP